MSATCREVLAHLPAALSEVRKKHPNARPQKRLVVHEIKRLLKEKDDRA